MGVLCAGNQQSAGSWAVSSRVSPCMASVLWGFPLTPMELFIFTNHWLLNRVFKMFLVWGFFLPLLLGSYLDYKINHRYSACWPGTLIERSERVWLWVEHRLNVFWSVMLKSVCFLSWSKDDGPRHRNFLFHPFSILKVSLHQ